MSMITASAWVPRGYPAAFPQKYAVDDDELARISKLAKLQLQDAEEDLEIAEGKDDENGEWEDADEDDDQDGEDVEGVSLSKNDESSAAAPNGRSNAEVDDDLREYDLENYDDEGGEFDEDIARADDEEHPMGALNLVGSPRSLAYHASNAEDPYITLSRREGADGSEYDSDEEDEREDLQVLESDNMLVAAKVEDEVAHLEVYIYEDDEANLYVHHDIMLPSIPLCVEWLDVPVGQAPSGQPVDQSLRGNFVAVGTFEPDIEIWDLDVVDCMYPNAILGEGGQQENANVIEDASTKKDKKKKKKKAVSSNPNWHTQAVLSLSASRTHRTLLASSSADKTIKLWDLSTQRCVRSSKIHTSKVCSVDFHPSSSSSFSSSLLSGSYDRTICVSDMRTPSSTLPAASFGVESDVEIVRWDPHSEHTFYVSTEEGMVHYFDVRNAPARTQLDKSKPLWSLRAHDKPVSAFSVNASHSGFFATGSHDREVKLWSTTTTTESGPRLLASKNIQAGKVFTLSFLPPSNLFPKVGGAADPSFRLAVGGSKGVVQIWDTASNVSVRKNVLKSAGAGGKDDAKERVVGVVDTGDDERDSDDEDAEEMDVD